MKLFISNYFFDNIIENTIYIISFFLQIIISILYKCYHISVYTTKKSYKVLKIFCKIIINISIILFKLFIRICYLIIQFIEYQFNNTIINDSNDSLKISNSYQPLTILDSIDLLKYSDSNSNSDSDSDSDSD